MRRAGLLLLCVLGLTGLASAEPIRIEVGLGGVFPVGQWTRCRISGLDDVKDGGLIVVHVDEVFETYLGVAGGRAEGLLLMPDESSAITMEIPGKGRVALPSEARKQLHGVKDKLPVIFLSGDNLPEESAVREALAAGLLSPIRMTTEEFFRYGVPDIEWVRVFVLGRMKEDDVERLRERFFHLSGSVLVARPDAVTGWLEKLAFEKVGELSVHNRSLAQLLPVPRGSVRPELYDVFGPPTWPKSIRRNVTLYFVSSLGLFAVVMVFPRRRGKLLGGGLVSAVSVSLLFMLMASWHLSAPPESVSLFEVPEEAVKGVETTLISQAVLSPSSGGLRLNGLGMSLSELNPVASYPAQWVEHKLRLNRMNELERDWPIPSREVFVGFSYSRWPIPREDGFAITGDKVVLLEGAKSGAPPFPWRRSSKPSQKPVSFADYMNRRQHEDSRVDELRRAMLRYWNKNRPKEKTYGVFWTEARTSAKLFSAGTMLVFEIPKRIFDAREAR